MSSNVWIVIAVLAVLLVVGALVWVGRNRQLSRRRAQADEIRDEVRQEQAKVARREALADETAAKARAAQAEAEAKAAEARRLADNADTHRAEVAARRQDLDERLSHADSIDPHVDTDKTPADTGGAEATQRPR